MGTTLMFNPFKKKPFEIDDFAKLVITEARKAGITHRWNTTQSVLF
jgi:hypothetical protein